MKLKNYKLLIMIVTVSYIFVAAYCYESNNCYEIVLNGKSIAYINNREDFEKVNEEVFNSIKERYGNFTYNDKVVFKRVFSNRENISDKEELKHIIYSRSHSTVAAYKILADKRQIAIVASKDEGTKLIKEVVDYYIKSKKNSENKSATVKNKITCERADFKLKELKGIHDIQQNIIKNSLITVVQKNITKEKEEINYKTNIITTDKISVGTEKVTVKGEKGEQLVEKEITLENNKVVATKVISKKTTKYPVNQIIQRGVKAKAVFSSKVVKLPVEGSISSNFGFRWGKIHQGIDIASSLGQPIYAAISGEVCFAGQQQGYGKLISISSSDGVTTMYGHCSSILVNKKQKVKKGDIIGKVGSTGNSTGPHLHFEVRVNGTAVDPYNYLQQN